MAAEIKKIDSTTVGGWPTAVPDVDHNLNLDESSGSAPNEGDYIAAGDDYDDESSYRDVFTKLDCTVLSESDTVNWIQIWMHAFGTGDSAKNIEVRLTNTDGVVIGEVAIPIKEPATATVTFTEDIDENPWTLTTINDISAIEVRPLVDGKDSDNDTWTIYQLYFKVDFIPAASALARSKVNSGLAGRTTRIGRLAG